MEAIKRIGTKSLSLLRILLGGLFVYAGVAKLMDVPAFQAQLQNFGLGDGSLAHITAHYLPCIEIICGLALMLRRLSLGAWTLYVSMLVMFEGGLVYAWWSGYAGSCGCFGKFFGGASVQMALVRNLVLFGIALALMLREISLMRKGVVR